jgi:hypothetical protein
MGFPIAILAEVALKVASKALDKKSATVELEKAIKADPVLANEMNAEPWYQSRVGVGSIVSAVGVVLPPLVGLMGWQVSGNQIVDFIQAVMTLGGALMALYGRFMPGLKPLGG